MPKRRIFVSAPGESQLNGSELNLYRAILPLVQRDEFGEDKFELQRFMISGLPAAKGWSFEEVEKVMRRCVGAVILAIPRWIGTAPWSPTDPAVPISGEFYNYEGAVALTLGLPTLILTTHGISDRGIVHKGGGKVICHIPRNSSIDWLSQDFFRTQFREWRNEVTRRSDIFLAYSSGARTTANAINLYLTGLGVRVLDWAAFMAAGTILDEIEQASARCTAGIFIFTEDDTLSPGRHFTGSGDTQAAPRDNVVFEAGFFANAKGRERTLIIREKQTKMPADVGGSIYLPLPDRHDISSIHDALRRFIDDRL